jgi:hypothetical protein
MMALDGTEDKELKGAAGLKTPVAASVGQSNMIFEWLVYQVSLHTFVNSVPLSAPGDPGA